MDINSLKEKLIDRLPRAEDIIKNTEFVEAKNIGDISVQTLSTDGEKIYYNTDYIEKLEEEETIYAFAVMVLHIQFNHINRGENKDSRLWDIATNAKINDLLTQDGFKPIPDGVHLDEAKNKSAEELYEMLKEKYKSKHEEHEDDKQPSPFSKN